MSLAYHAACLRDQLLEHLKGPVGSLLLQEGKKTVYEDHGQDRQAQLGHIHAGDEAKDGRDPEEYCEEAKEVP